MNYVSFSLYGKDPRYIRGAIRNAELIPQFYPDWRIVVFHDRSVPSDALNELVTLDVELVDCTRMGIDCKPMWRFLINDRADAARWISRDVDSRPNARERWAVNEWIKSYTPFHVIRDHPNHYIWPVYAGMFGAMKGLVGDMQFLIRNYLRATPSRQYGVDQDFLRDCIWPKARYEVCAHAYEGAPESFGKQNSLPPRFDHRFVGEVFDGENKPRDGEWQMITGVIK